ncbi:MAG: hypothetical protein Q9173_000061 [Seirophora scorigena]
MLQPVSFPRLSFTLTLGTAFVGAATPRARPSELVAFNQRYTIPDSSVLEISPSDPFLIPSTPLFLHTVRYSHAVPYDAFATTLLTALDEVFQYALAGEIHDRQPIPTTISEWHEGEAVLAVQGKGLNMEDLGSSLKGLALWAQRWGFHQRGGVSGIWNLHVSNAAGEADARGYMQLESSAVTVTKKSSGGHLWLCAVASVSGRYGSTGNPDIVIR